MGERGAAYRPVESLAAAATWAPAPRPQAPGWALIFPAGQAAVVVMRVLHLARAGRILWRVGGAEGAAADVVRAYASTRAMLLVMLLALGTAGIAKILRRSPDTRRYWLVGIPLMLTLSLAIVGMNVAEADAFTGITGDSAPSSVDASTELAQLVGVAVWWSYWKWSQRVRKVFSPRASLPGAPWTARPHEAPVPARTA